jgi:hypothetical protein
MARHRSGDMLQLFMVKIGKFYDIIMILGRNALFFVFTMLTSASTALQALKTLGFAMMLTTAFFTHTFYHDNIYKDTYNIINERCFKKY